ncbi:hypothetical protein ZIOFF_046189 [Zingiber officinale]|uniref:Uncharacterized protein n=1 Tax=Zingiber officinale TaxID=94328 RepID=A0A8J5G4M0_ZINOF|nr:hypothetical protein ZIOFF_046189 [Zingiber officinale]
MIASQESSRNAEATAYCSNGKDLLLVWLRQADVSRGLSWEMGIKATECGSQMMSHARQITDGGFCPGCAFRFVVVEDLNFVHRIGENKKPTNPDKLIKEESTAPISFDSAEETMDRLRLWQIFFANPHEWWDNREHKLYPTSPDFRHKDTAKCLRLMPNDPPWIQRQLQRYDSSTATQSDKEDRKYSKVDTDRPSMMEWDLIYYADKEKKYAAVVD